MKFLKIFSFLLFSLVVFSVFPRNVFLEFKGSYFLPTGNSFKKIYKGNALYGPELTVQLWDEKNWYWFASFDYLKTDGHSIGLLNPTVVRLYPLAAGMKYFFFERWENVDFYAGLGFQAMNVHTKNRSPFVKSTISKWGFGGIAKIGGYFYLPHNFLIDIFIDYSFISAGSTNFFSPAPGLEFRKADLSGAIFGIALGYRF